MVYIWLSVYLNLGTVDVLSALTNKHTLITRLWELMHLGAQRLSIIAQYLNMEI